MTPNQRHASSSLPSFPRRPIRKQRPAAQRGFRVGDQLFATTASGWEPATVVAPANRGGVIGYVRVRNAAGREYEAPVINCYFDTASFRRFVAAIRARNTALGAVLGACRAKGFVLGGSACAELPEYRAYQAASRAASGAGGELERSHPYY